MRISDWSSDVCSSDLPSACEANPPWISWRSSAVVVGVMGESLETITLLGVKPTRGDWAARSTFPASFGSALGSACICASARRSRHKRLFLSGSPPGILLAGPDADNQRQEARREG